MPLRVLRRVGQRHQLRRQRRAASPTPASGAGRCDGRRALSRSFSISPNTRSAGSSRKRHGPRTAAPSRDRPCSSKRAASCTARSARSGSSPKWLRVHRAQDAAPRGRARPPCGSCSSPRTGSKRRALMVKSRRREASSSDSDGSPTTAMPRCPGPGLRVAARQRHVHRALHPFEAAQLEDREGLAHRVDGTEAASTSRTASAGRPKTSTSRSFAGQPEQRVADGAPDDERPPAARGEGVDHAPQRRRHRDVHAEMVPKPLTGGVRRVHSRSRTFVIARRGPEAFMARKKQKPRRARGSDSVGEGPSESVTPSRHRRRRRSAADGCDPASPRTARTRATAATRD